ncbi:MAG: hypothetical protein G01um101425_558 [Candidatus Peregrinibacteria bacterium Gr01-1014_25]|nr:MAG: hypothetical protein G01um101425_558 [Candidatus Peregrinibacteria bacterium Gr01-1014_25]
MTTEQTPTRRRGSSLGHVIEQSTMLLMICIGALILLLAVLILFHQNANATKGYRLRTLERERSELLLEEEVLRMRIAHEQSLEYLQEDEHIKSMIPQTKPIYARPK